ncbi:head involution defective isoform 2-T2 [Cochliomyia hominivorax]
MVENHNKIVPLKDRLTITKKIFQNIYFERMKFQIGSHIFQYPTPPSPSCSVHSPSYTGGGEFIFPRSRSTSRIPRTSVSFAAGDEVNFFHQSAPTSSSSTGGNAQTQTTQAPQSAPPIPNSHHHNGQHPLHGHYPYFGYPHIAVGGNSGGGHYQYTPPPTPNTAAATTSTGTSTTTGAHRSLHRSLSDSARRSRLTSTGEDEREYQSEHETSWDDEFDDRYDNFTAGRERLQEFNGRIPPRKKKKDVPKTKPEKKEQSFTWPAVVTVFVFAMGCGFLVAR